MNALNKRRFDIVEVTAIAFFVGFLGWMVGTSRRPLNYANYTAFQEAQRLKEAYGPHRYSESLEEWIIRDFFKDLRGGFFVDVGANHYRDNSNTFYLEEHLGWSGVAIEPQASFQADYQKHRPRTRFFPLFVSDVSSGPATLYVADRHSLSASGERDFVQMLGKTVSETSVPTVTLTQLLSRLAVDHVDLLSIDVELSEPKVLKGFDIDRFRPRLVCIEAHPEVRQQILDYFARHSYVVAGEYLRVDTTNLYFKPLT